MVSHDDLWPAVALHCTLQERQCSPAIPALCGEDFEYLTFVIDGAPEIMCLTVDTDKQSSGAGESHPRALTEPYVNLSIHPALIVQPLKTALPYTLGSSHLWLTRE